MQADDLPLAVGVHRDSNYRRDRHHPAALALLQVCRIEPQIRPFAGQRTIQERVHPLVDVLAELRDLAFADPRQPHGLHQIVDPPGRDAADPRLLDHRDKRLLGRLPGLAERREVGALPEFGETQLQRAEAGIQGAIAVAVPPGRALGAALVATGADHTVNIGLHQDLQHRLRYGSQKIAFADLLEQVGQWHSLVCHRVSFGSA